MFSRFLSFFKRILKPNSKILSRRFVVFVAGALILSVALISLGVSKAYQSWDDDPDRGAVAIMDGAFGESYKVPEYLDQGWDEADSLWFYNTTQGSGLLPYDFFLVLEQADSDQLFRSNENIDKFRYLPQKETFFNPDALPVGFAKDTYKGKDYMGFTCDGPSAVARAADRRKALSTRGSPLKLRRSHTPPDRGLPLGRVADGAGRSGGRRLAGRDPDRCRSDGRVRQEGSDGDPRNGRGHRARRNGDALRGLRGCAR